MRPRGRPELMRPRGRPELQIINHLREADVLLAQGRTVGEVCRRIGVSEQSYYRWLQESDLLVTVGAGSKSRQFNVIRE